LPPPTNASLLVSSVPIVSGLHRPTTRLPAGWGRRLASALPQVVELMAVVAAIAVFLPLFDRVAHIGPGRDQRFLDRGVAVAALPDAPLTDLCQAYADLAEAPVREALCRTRGAALRAQSLATVPGALSTTIERTLDAFAKPLGDAAARIDALRGQAQKGDLDAGDNADAIAAIEAEIAPFADRYQLSGSAGPAPLRCAALWLKAAFPPRRTSAPETDGADSSARANAVLLLANALDGRAAATVAGDARLPVAATSSPTCPGAVETIAATAALMADARQAVSNTRKNDAMRALVQSAGVQWAAAMAIGYAFLLWSRRTTRPALGIATALAVWAAAAWLARVPWPFADRRGFLPARLDPSFGSAPAAFVWCLAAAALVLCIASLARPAPARAPRSLRRQSMSSRVGYAGLVIATGFGCILLLDLSINGHPGNRYLALYHQGHLWLAMLMLSTFLFLRQSLSRALTWTLSVAGELGRRAARRRGRLALAIGIAVLTLFGLFVFSFGLANRAQLTSELGRVWLIVGAAWFFFLRAGPMTERLARSGPTALSFLGYAWPMLFVVAVLIAAMFATHDMGPLLISGYASGAFVAATLAMWWHHRSGQVVSAFALAALVFATWIGVVTAALFQVGSFDAVTASRLESVAAPFASINDQLAMVSWFQGAAPAQGFGIGSTPWCGFSPSHACSGVPAQIHSDYTLTAMVGVFGPLLSWALCIGATLWLHRLIRHHGRVTRGEPRLIDVEGRLANDGQALLSWIAVAWVVLTSCQLAVTVAGNLAVLPLTGVTFPFVSFGMTSLLVNMMFLALCLNVDLPSRDRHG
jgi:cell division protein FtsW (lipid II flippase)